MEDKVISKITYMLTVLSLCACSSPNIQDNTLNDRVKACSAGFSDTAKDSLNGSVSMLNLQGGISNDFREQTKSVIFDELPPADRLKGYEDYITCVEKNWNQTHP